MQCKQPDAKCWKLMQNVSFEAAVHFSANLSGLQSQASYYTVTFNECVIELPRG